AAEPEIAQRRKVRTEQKSLDHMQALLRRKTGKKLLDEIRGQTTEIENLFILAGSQRGNGVF
ncbi:MAG: hypothetical protein ACI9BD_001292, partial [Candidatus Marinamargulisbacteria bacterium]